ncbi:Armadillo-type fold [Amanita muscaria]
MSSPRLGAHPSAMPPPPPPPMSAQMQPPVPWPGYYYPGAEHQHQHYMQTYPGWNWAPPQMSPATQHPHQHPHQHPPSGPHTSGVPMSPRTHAPPLQSPGTPTLAHAAPVPVSHPPPPISHAPSSSMSSMSSPPPTPASALPAGRLNANSSAFVPGGAAPHKKVVLKNEDGIEVNLETLTTKAPPTPSVTARQNLPATPTRKAAPIRIETPEQRQKRLEEEEQKEKEAKAKASAEERAKREKEEEERRKEEEDRKKKEEEERKQKEEEEKECLRKEEEEMRRQKEEKERLRREEEDKEKLRKEDEARALLRKEEEQKEKERLRREEEDKRRREQEEQNRIAEEKAKEEEERRKAEEDRALKQKQEEEAKAQMPTVDDAVMTEEQAKEDEVTQEPEEGELPSKDDAKERSREALRIDTALSEKRRPGPLDLSGTRPPPSPLALARPLGNLDSITYPKGISSPKPELNVGAKEGKFRYDRDFLMQFMSICKEKPDSLPPLDAIGLEPVDPLSLTRGGSGRHRQLSGTSAPSRQASIGGGLPGGAPRGQFQSMGSFTTTPSKLHSERFEAPGNRSVSMSGPNMPFRNPPLQRTASQGGVGPMQSHRTRSKRGEKRSDAGKAGVGPQAHGPAYGHQYGAFQGPNLEPVAPLQMAENRWDRRSFHNNDPDSPEVVDRKVKALLNKLTMEKFDSISDQIIQWANRSENQKDGRTLIQVIRLVFEKATDEATWSEMYARLCRKMMEQISPKVQDEGIKNSDGNPITGGQLFRKYLLNRCQEDFERGWFAKEATAAAAASKAAEDQAVKAANETNESGEVALYSDEYYAASKAKRQGLGLIKFIGELFKLQMLTERIMHECIKKLLGNVQNPEEEEIESLCKLLSTVGALLDTPKARAHLDVYFQRIQELSKNVNPRMQFMLQDLLELRDRKWQARNAVAAPATIAQVHEAAAKEKADKEKEATQQRLSMSRGGSRRGGPRDDHPQADGWSSVSRPPARAGDLSQFGRISKPQPPTTFGPSSVFAGKKDLKREPISRTNSSSNMFSALQEAQQESNKAVDQPLHRKKLVLQPRSKPAEEPTPPPEESVTPSSEEASPVSALTEEAADAKISEDVKEFFSIRNLDEAEVYFTALPSQHHHRLVNKLVSSAVESKERDAVLVADLFKRANSKELCSSDALEEGLTPTAEIIEDIAIDAPKAWSLFATMVKGAQFDEEHRTRLASKTADSDKLLGLLSS